MKNFSYTDIMSMPVYERRFFIQQFIKDNKKMQEQQSSQNTKGGKGSRTKRIGGDELKTRMKNGQIPLS